MSVSQGGEIKLKLHQQKEAQVLLYTFTFMSILFELVVQDFALIQPELET
jgi:hypothetical protein